MHTNLRKVYVGSWYKSVESLMFARLRTHLTTANACCKQPSRPWGQGRDDSQPRLLYQHWIVNGLTDWHMFPLQLFASDEDTDFVLQCEQQWIDRYQAVAPMGFNTVSAQKKTAFRHTSQVIPLAVARVFDSRNMCRRVGVCYKAYDNKRRTGENYTAFFDRYQRKSLVRMSCFLRVGVDNQGRT